MVITEILFQLSLVQLSENRPGGACSPSPIWMSQIQFNRQKDMSRQELDVWVSHIHSIERYIKTLTACMVKAHSIKKIKTWLQNMVKMKANIKENL